MPLVMASLLTVQAGPVRRFLEAALRHDAPQPEALVEMGVPHYEATLFSRRMHEAGELCDHKWVGDVRNAYQELLERSDPNVRRLDRLHASDRPREKALHAGVSALADAELLALLLRTGSGDEGVLEFAERLLLDNDGILGLARHDLAVLLRERGLGPAKATELAAAFELANRVASAARRRERPLLDSPEAAVAHLREVVLLDHERFWCLSLDARSRLIGEPRQISQGDVDGTDAGPRAFFRTALAVGATSCIAVHNHPTGDPAASAADMAVTARLVAAGRLIDVRLVDHLILGDSGRFTSIRRSHPETFR